MASADRDTTGDADALNYVEYSALKTPRQLSPDSSPYVNGELTNCGPIDQIVRIDELLEKAQQIDQLGQLINRAQQIISASAGS
jgi:hypothetical protein